MGSITREGSSVNVKAVFAAAVREAEAAVVKRLGEAVAQGLDANSALLLGRSAYVRSPEPAASAQRASCAHGVNLRT